jgi:hypothetical protein
MNKNGFHKDFDISWQWMPSSMCSVEGKNILNKKISKTTLVHLIITNYGPAPLKWLEL